MINFNVKIKSLLTFLLLLLFGSNVFAAKYFQMIKGRFSARGVAEKSRKSMGDNIADEGDLEQEGDEPKKHKHRHKKRKHCSKDQHAGGSGDDQPAKMDDLSSVVDVAVAAEIGGNVVASELEALNTSPDTGRVREEGDVVGPQGQEEGAEPKTTRRRTLSEGGLGEFQQRESAVEVTLSRRSRSIVDTTPYPPIDQTIAILDRMGLYGKQDEAESSEGEPEDDEVLQVDQQGVDGFLAVEVTEPLQGQVGVAPVAGPPVVAASLQENEAASPLVEVRLDVCSGVPSQELEGPGVDTDAYQQGDQPAVGAFVAEGFHSEEEADYKKPPRKKRRISHEPEWLSGILGRMCREALDSPWTLVGKIGSMPLVEWFAGGAAYLADLFSLRELLASLHLVQKVTEEDLSGVSYEVPSNVKRAVTLLVSAYVIYFFYNKLRRPGVTEDEAVAENPVDLIGTRNTEALVGVAEGYLQARSRCRELDGDASEEAVRETRGLQKRMTAFEDRMSQAFAADPSLLKQVELAFFEEGELLGDER